MMKTKKMLTLMLAVMLLVASLAVTVHADVDYYSFNGNCKRFFTTNRHLEQQDKDWSPYVAVICSDLSFSGSPSYDYGYTVLILEDGSEYGKREYVYKDEYQVDDQTLLTMPLNYEGTTVRTRMIHPYYKKNNATATSTMHIVGTVGKQILC